MTDSGELGHPFSQASQPKRRDATRRWSVGGCSHPTMGARPDALWWTNSCERLPHHGDLGRARSTPTELLNELELADSPVPRQSGLTNGLAINWGVRLWIVEVGDL